MTTILLDQHPRKNPEGKTNAADEGLFLSYAAAKSWYNNLDA